MLKPVKIYIQQANFNTCSKTFDTQQENVKTCQIWHPACKLWHYAMKLWHLALSLNTEPAAIVLKYLEFDSLLRFLSSSVFFWSWSAISSISTFLLSANCNNQDQLINQLIFFYQSALPYFVIINIYIINNINKLQ